MHALGRVAGKSEEGHQWPHQAVPRRETPGAAVQDLEVGPAAFRQTLL